MFSVLLFVTYLTIFWSFNGFLLYIDTHETRFDKYRLQKTKPKLTTQPDLVKRIITGTILNHVGLIILTPILYYLMSLRGKVVVTGPTPSLTTIILHLLAYSLSEDFLFYWTHYLTHVIPKVYQFMHREHHHYRQPIGLVSMLADPFESATQNQITTWLLPALMPEKHVLTICLWVLIRIHQTVNAHCGYDLPYITMKWYFPWLFVGARVHDYHHRVGSYNYGSFFTIWDRLNGTYKHEASDNS
jgi:4-alpha-methyl-delta7-sterol-4alpha-methyl oxidase